MFAAIAADPDAELSYKDQVALAADRLVEFATGLAGGAAQVNPSRS
jgi:hypothetical protein